MDIDREYTEAVQLHKCKQLAAAEQAYRAVLNKSPQHVEALHGLAALLVQRHGPAQCDVSRHLLKTAIQLRPSDARLRHSVGVVEEKAEDLAAAADALRRACDKDLVSVRLRLDLARVLKADDRHAAAADAYRGALRIQPDHPTGHYKLACALRQLGRHAAAADAFRAHLCIDPGHAQAAFWLAALTGDTTAVAVACPADMVAGLFDQYADHFEEHLVGKLGYRTPNTLMDVLLQAAGATGECSTNSSGGGMDACSNDSGNVTDASTTSSSDTKASRHRWRRCVDLGCGTGLMGALLPSYVEGHLEGVDLSAGMVERAAARGCYDALEVGELVQFLQQRRRHQQETAQGAAGRYDLLVAADVFVYIGDLLPVLKAAAEVACHGALFCFSTELPASTMQCSSSSNGNGSLSKIHSNGHNHAPCSCDPRYQLQPTGRFAHSPQYLRHVAAAAGWTLVLCAPLQQATIRMNAGAPINGNLCVLQHGAAQVSGS